MNTHARQRRRAAKGFPAILALAILCLGACAPADSNPGEAAAPPAATLPDAAPSEAATPPAAAAPDTTAGEAASPPATTAPRVLTAAGWGPLRIGMTRAEVVAAAGEDANPDAVGGPDPATCDEFRPARAPEGMLVMIERGRLTRITLSAGTDVSTDRGFRVGDPAASIKGAYGEEAEVSPHKYVPAPAEYITTWTTAPPAPDARGLVYEIGADGRVMHIHAGGPSIRYVEGCL